MIWYRNLEEKKYIEHFDGEITEEDRIRTLSICADNNKYRVVLHDKRINE